MLKLIIMGFYIVSNDIYHFLLNYDCKTIKVTKNCKAKQRLNTKSPQTMGAIKYE